MRTRQERFDAKHVVADNGCWEWIGAISSTGYGNFVWGKNETPRTTGAHRAAYQLYVGEITTGLEVDHLCRNRKCVNPKHLELVARRENLHRAPKTIAAKNAGKTHCPQNHPYSAKNTYVRNGMRFCKECRRQSVRRWRVQQTQEIS